MEHTPGPWAASFEDRELFVKSGAGTEVAIVCKYRMVPGERESNAHLIAAAPALLAETEKFATLVELIERWADADEGADDIMDNIVGLAQSSNPAAAISKAKGA